ncbi:MAG: DUF5590 domain-containing protein [Lactobacillales bacterium]|jgi:uncharacterized protein YpmB|nr:DUF5590 domain-containing protein [Lactobacillales bacterium]
MKNETQWSRGERTLLTIFIVLLVMIVGSVILIIKSDAPLNQAKKEATTIAKQYAKMNKVEDFYHFTRKETYYSVLGTDDTGREIAVIVPKNGSKITVLEQSKGITAQQAGAIVLKQYDVSKVRNINLGIFDNKPVWEVVGEHENGTISYYLLSFEDGAKVSNTNEV